MKKLFLSLVLSLVGLNSQAALYTEFYCQTTGDNLNAGSETSDSARLTYASGTWVASTGIFTVASGNPSSDGVLTNEWVSVYPDGSTGATPFVGRVTARDTTTITVSLTIKGGTAPTDGALNRTLKVGGAWKGPNGTVGHPFNFVSGIMTNSAVNKMRVNFKAQQYSITAGMTHTLNGAIFEGYSTTPGDLTALTPAKAEIVGPATGTSFVLINNSGGQNEFRSLSFTNNGNTGTANMFTSSGANTVVKWCMFWNGVRSELETSSSMKIWESFFANPNSLNAASQLGAGLVMEAAGCEVIRCVFTNTTANSKGIYMDTPCVASGNIVTGGQNGIISTASTMGGIYNNSIYNVSGAGIDLVSAVSPAFYFEIFITGNAIAKVGTYAINSSGVVSRHGLVANNVIGATTGTFSVPSGLLNGEIDFYDNTTLAANVSPWIDAANGDFRPNPQAWYVGGGNYLVNPALTTTSVPIRDAGPINHRDVGTSSTFSQ